MKKPLLDNSRSIMALAGALILLTTGANAQSTGPEDATAMSAAAETAIGARDADGHVVIRAQRLREHIVVDGRLDESFYQQFKPRRIRPGRAEYGARNREHEVWGIRRRAG